MLCYPSLVVAQAPSAEVLAGAAWWEGVLEYSWPLMSFVLGLIDGFNPCAMWTLFILLGFLLTMEDARKRWLIGGVFIASSGLIYLAALFTYLIGFQTLTSMVATKSMSFVFTAIGLMALVAGFWAVYNYRQKGIECDVRDADSKRKFHQQLGAILNREKMWLVLAGMVLLAFSVNAFELLCSFAIPTVFTSTLVSLELDWWQKITALLIYDVAYILDDLLVFTIAIKTLSLKVFSPRVTQIANLIGGLVLIVLGLLLVFDSEQLMSWFSWLSDKKLAFNQVIFSIEAMKWILVLFFGMSSWLYGAEAQKIPTLDFFHGRECPHCQNEKAWFPTLKQAYPDIVINEYEVWHEPANQVLWAQRLAEFDMEPSGVPTNIIGDEVITGFAPEQIVAALEATYGAPAVDILATPEPQPSWWNRLSRWIKQWLGLAPSEKELTVVPPEGIHFHTNFHLYVNDQRFDLSGDEFMTESEACYGVPGKEKENLADFVHLHYNVGDVVHIHAEGVRWQTFLETLGFSFEADQVTFQEKVYAAAELQVYSENAENVNIESLIARGVPVVVALQSAELNVLEALEKVPRNASEYDSDDTECH